MRAGEMPTAKRPRSPGSPGSASEAPTFVITVVDGPDKGLVLTIDGGGANRALVGTSPLCTLRLSDREVSRRHISLRAHGEVLEVLDLGSTNGTTVNGVSIREVLVRGGEAIRVGGTVLSTARGGASTIVSSASSGFGRLLGESSAMRALYPVLERLATSKDPVLIEGEMGTGKELCAEEIHRRGATLSTPGQDGPFAVLETAQLGEDEIGPRLFGSEDSITRIASGGSVFIDEIADLPKDAQEQLLRALNDPSSPRFFLATRCDLDRAVAEGKFSEELLHRLASTRIELPPLRERGADVRLLASSFWSSDAAEPDAPDAQDAPDEPDEPDETLPHDFLPRFEHYPWPGNVRELSAAVEARRKLGALGAWKFDRQRAPSTDDFIHAVVSQDLPFARARQIVIDELERRYVDEVLARNGGSVARAAQASGLALRYFQLIRARRAK